ncbi:hypothetical protein ACWGCP_36420 [Streptomyces niveus]|uniref:hypothetical protein n=1 Tax=Streptomyces niveus TaxID=193462 RepID=UPI0034427259
MSGLSIGEELPMLSAVLWRLSGDDSWQAPRFEDLTLVDDGQGGCADGLFADLTDPSPEIPKWSGPLAWGRRVG